jgi:hypothetical protein
MSQSPDQDSRPAFFPSICARRWGAVERMMGRSMWPTARKMQPQPVASGDQHVTTAIRWELNHP